MTKLNVSRASFTEVKAPRDQPCSCDCGERILKGQKVFARGYAPKRGRGESRIIDLDSHYNRWIDQVSSAYASKISKRSSKFRRYMGEE